MSSPSTLCLISFHRVRENDSGDMDLLCKEAFGAIAGKNRSVDLVVHPRKSGPGEINTTIDDGGDNSKADLSKINKLLKTWRQNKVLDIEKRPDEEYKEREFYIGGSATAHPTSNGSNYPPVDS